MHLLQWLKWKNTIVSADKDVEQASLHALLMGMPDGLAIWNTAGQAA